MINEATTLATLVTVHIVALMRPGPDFALVVQNAGRYGRQTGVMIALGLSLGILLRSLLSLTGASLLIHQHPMLFNALQGAGGGYLLWLGYGALKATIGIRLSEEAEFDGADISIHNIGAYPEDDLRAS